MPRKSTMPPSASPDAGADVPAPALAPTFVRPITATDGTIGGKARSLARLAALGLPVPPAFAVSAAAFTALRTSGPAVPQALGSAFDVAQLEAARGALLDAPVPPGFDDQVRVALADLAAATRDLPPTDGFAVRSSGATEDRAGVLAPGVFASEVRIPAPAVLAAIRRVMASYLEPAAWIYAGATGEEVAGGVLIHPFVIGTSFGACACDPATAAGEDDVLVAPSPEAPAPPTPGATAEIRRAARLAASAHGPCELEWVSDGDRVLFLQLRPYHAPVAMADAVAPSSIDWSEAAGWTWDAAHNPAALSPAQAGLVQWVDTRCRIGLRQRVFGGYLHYRADAASVPAPSTGGEPEPRAAFERVRAAVERRLAELGGEAPLGAVLEAYVDGYQGLYGEVGPALARARHALMDFLRAHAPQPAAAAALLAGVPSIAVERRSAARAIATAATARDRQAAIESYLQRHGDESGSWDVIEPTFAEDPRPLVLLGQATTGDDLARVGAPPPRPTAAPAPAVPQLSPDEAARFQDIVEAARAAVSVGEDDDALFARLQAAVRRALLRLGGRLAAQGALDQPGDVFFLPLALSAALDTAPTVPELRSIVAANRRAWADARRSPPPAPTGRAADARAGARVGIIRGLPGAPGRVVGRAVHHPSSAPLGPDAVLIASTLLPTELPLLSPAALVVETGTVLGHVAAQARERNLPAVVGAVHARDIAEDALVLVDGDRGEVTLL